MAKAEKTKSKRQIKNQTIKDMEALGTYKSEYDKIIDIYAELVYQYNTISDRFEQENFKYQVMTAQGGLKKSPIVATLESLRKDILAYSDRLCLNPKAIESVTVQKGNKSALAQALQDLS